MQLSDLREIFKHFAVDAIPTAGDVHGEGLINSTLAIKTDKKKTYILQQINTYVFKKPDEVMENIVGVTAFLSKKIALAGGDVMRQTLQPIPTVDGKFFYRDEKTDACWRLYHFIDGATAYQSVDREGILFEAAKAFGNFQRQLSDYPADTLYETIPDFHNTAARYAAFEEALAADRAGRAASVTEDLQVLRDYAPYATMIVDRLADGRLPMRVTHNDTKLNNVMIDDATGKGLCVIDLDTVMPGSLLYDFGDSVRFAANNGKEDDRDLSNVWLREDRYEEYVSGFLSGIGDSITEEELNLLPESVLILTYELALRFMTDYLNGDLYFKTLSEDHNLVRTRAQIRLMENIKEQLQRLHTITQTAANKA